MRKRKESGQEQQKGKRNGDGGKGRGRKGDEKKETGREKRERPIFLTGLTPMHYTHYNCRDTETI